MGVIEIRLCDEDRKKHGDDDSHPEWVPFDRQALDHVPFDVQRPWEKEMGIGVLKLLYREFDEMTALGIKGVVWLAWKMAGLDTPAWDYFNIHTNVVRWREVTEDEDGDADPPAHGSSEPSPETLTTTPSTESSPL